MQYMSVKQFLLYDESLKLWGLWCLQYILLLFGAYKFDFLYIDSSQMEINIIEQLERLLKMSLICTSYLIYFDNFG